MDDEKNVAPAGQGPTSANENTDRKDKEISRGYIYRDDLICLNYLSDEQKGQLLAAINRCMFYGGETDIKDNIVNVAFAPIRQHIQRDYKAYQEKCETNRNNSNERRCVKERVGALEMSDLNIHEPSKIVDARWKNLEIAGVLIPAKEFHLAYNLFFWKNFPSDQIIACYDFYGKRKEGWGQWTTPNARWNNAICKWTNRTGKKRFPDNILSMVGEIFDLSPDEIKNCITRREFNIEIQPDNGVCFIYGANLPIGNWLQTNREVVEKITAKYGYGKISGKPYVR